MNLLKKAIDYFSGRKIKRKFNWAHQNIHEYSTNTGIEYLLENEITRDKNSFKKYGQYVPNFLTISSLALATFYQEPRFLALTALSEFQRISEYLKFDNFYWHNLKRKVRILKQQYLQDLEKRIILDNLDKNNTKEQDEEHPLFEGLDGWLKPEDFKGFQ